MVTKLNKIFLPVSAHCVEINDFIQNLIDEVAKIREKQIKHGVVDNKIMVLNSNNDQNITLQYYDVDIKEEENV
jgi:hypothetical protein